MVYEGAPTSELPDGQGGSGSESIMEYRLSKKLLYFLNLITLSAAATKDTVALTFAGAALLNPIPAGVILHFDSGNIGATDVLVTQDALAAATTLVTAPLPRALAIGTKANWDGYVPIPSLQAPKVTFGPEFDSQKVTSGGRRGAGTIKTKIGTDDKFSFATIALANHPFITPLIEAGTADGNDSAIDFRLKVAGGLWLIGSGFIGLDFETPERGTVKIMVSGEVSGQAQVRIDPA